MPLRKFSTLPCLKDTLTSIEGKKIKVVVCKHDVSDRKIPRGKYSENDLGGLACKVPILTLYFLEKFLYVPIYYAEVLL